MADSASGSDFSSENSSDLSANSSDNDSDSVELSEGDFEDRIIVAGAVQGYQFEPQISDIDGASESGDSTSDSSEEDANLAKWRKRMHTTSWCECFKCENSTIPEENACCREKVPINNTLEEYNADFEPGVSCITDHPAFHTHCLDVWSLQLAYRLYQKKEVPGATNTFSASSASHLYRSLSVQRDNLHTKGEIRSRYHNVIVFTQCKMAASTLVYML